jgi:hypothetical protein
MATDKSTAQAVGLAHGLHVLDDDAADWIAKKAAELDAQNGAAGEGECAHINTVRGTDGMRWCQHCEQQLSASTPPDPAADVARGGGAGCDAPCVFCGYSGAGYWQKFTHARYCPWYEIGGMAERRYYMRTITSRLTAGAGNGVDEASELRKVAKRNLRSLIERGSDDKALMLRCLEELS